MVDMLLQAHDTSLLIRFSMMLQVRASYGEDT